MKLWFSAVLFCFWPFAVLADFTGPSQQGEKLGYLTHTYKNQLTTVSQARQVAFGQYVSLTGFVISHIRADYYIFKDQTGEVVVEIEPAIWRNREVGPNTPIRIVAEVDRDAADQRYLWVESITLLES